jgi:integrase
MRVAKRMKRGRSRWTADYMDGTGKRVQKVFATREAAEEYVAQATLLARTKTAPDLPTGITYSEFATRAFELKTHLKKRTRASYVEINTRYLVPAFGATRIRDLRRATVRGFLAKQLTCLSTNMVRLMFAIVHLVMAEAVEAGLVPANPLGGLGRKLHLGARKAKRQEEVRAKAMTRAQRDTFLATAERVEPWWTAMWAVQVLTGLRPGEVYALEEGDLDLDARTIRVVRTLVPSDDDEDAEGTYDNTPKGGRARTVDLSAEAVAVLRAHLARRRAEKLHRGWREIPAALFCARNGTYPDQSNVRRAFNDVQKAAGLPHFTPHGLRHTFASLLLQAGVDVYYVSRMLGHADIGLTVNTYGSWLNPSRPGALDVLDRAQRAEAQA